MQIRVLLTVLALTIAFWPGVARAQVPTTLPEEAPFTFGKAQLYPLYSVEVAATDNLYYQSDQNLKFCVGGTNSGACTSDADCGPGETCVPGGTGRVGAAYASLEPGFVLDLPFSSSHSRVGYVLDYRSYGSPHTDQGVTVELPSVPNHYFVAETELQFANGGRFTARDDFQHGALSSVQRDPTTPTGSVVDFTSRDDRFRSNNAVLTLGHSRGATRSINLSGYSHVLSFLGDARYSYYEMNALGVSLAGEHEVQPRLRLSWELAYDHSDLSQQRREPQPAGCDVGVDPGCQLVPVAPDERTIVEQSWQLGGTWLLLPDSALTLKAGWQRDRSQASIDENSRSLTGSLTYLQGIPGRLQLTASLVRDVYTGVYGNNDTFLENRMSVSLGNDARARLVLAGQFSYSTDHFPDPPTRDDRTLDGELSIGYRLGRFAVTRFYARRTHRNSDEGNVVQSFDYDVKTVGFTLGIGD